MKKVLCISIFVLGVVSCSNNKLYAAIGCLDDKIHVNIPGGRRYEPICCNCPCWRYKHTSDRNRCDRCLHYHDPREFEY